MTAVFILAVAWACTSVAALAGVLLVVFREPEPVVLPARACGPDCGPCAVADDAVLVRDDLDRWAMEMQEHTS